MRYIIGIDLGTTNCALSYIDTEQPALSAQQFAIPQLTAPGKVAAQLTLPSFCYLTAPGEWPKGALHLPWKQEAEVFVGQLAKTHGARVPTRQVQSAKSWLCNVAANRKDKILPVEAADPTQRLSPVEASAHYLIHLKEAWNATMAKGNPAGELEEQEVILTVPASFDEVARSLTAEAARLAGLQHFTLVEEPQAAFYSWIADHEKNWEEEFQAGENILVCDVGGGTTDFSLIEIAEQNGKLSLQRTAVGDHLLLGGDNLDVALAHYIEQKRQQNNLPPLESIQWLQLLAEARSAKETLLAADKKQDDVYTIVLQGMGSSVIKGGCAVDIARKEIESLLLAGYFGRYTWQEALQHKSRRGFRTMGLPYEDEPAITKHLALFLKQAHFTEGGKGIDYLLFNGGTLQPEIFQSAIEQSLKEWFPQTPVKKLVSASLDLAVARGAAYYGKVRRGLGVSIGGGLPRSLYLKIDVAERDGTLQPKAMTLVPRGAQEGWEFYPERVFSARPNMPVAFRLMTSHVRLHDKEDDLVEIDPLEMQPLAPIQTILRFGKKLVPGGVEGRLPVKLGARLTAIGTVELWLQSQISEHKWNLEFQLRSATGQESISPQVSAGRDETYTKEFLAEASQSIELLFGPDTTIKPSQIMERLAAQIGQPRRAWGSSLLRELWSALLKMATCRKKSPEHEARWWNLAGFFLRPGFGFPLDDFRMKELWKVLLSDFKGQKSLETQIQMSICLRRVAGGLGKGQQMQVGSELGADLFDRKTGKIDSKRKGDLYLYSEKIRALASFERLEFPFKMSVGEALVDRIAAGKGCSSDYWALSRIGARHLLYGSVGQVVPKEICTKWLEKLLTHQPAAENRDEMVFLLRQLARKTDHRELNIGHLMVQKIIDAYPQEGLQEWLLEEKTLTSSEKESIFGEQLPSGLILEEEPDR